MPFSSLFSLLQSQSSMSLRNVHVLLRPFLIHCHSSSVMRTLISRSSLSMTWFCCALIKNDVLENPVDCERMILWQASQMTLLMWKSNQNSQISTHRSNVNFCFNVDSFNVYIALTMSCCLCLNNNMFSAVSICCSVTLTDTIIFSWVRTVHFSTMNVCSSCLKASCTLKVTLQGFTESTCLTNASSCLSTYVGQRSTFCWNIVANTVRIHQPVTILDHWALNRF